MVCLSRRLEEDQLSGCNQKPRAEGSIHTYDIRLQTVESVTYFLYLSDFYDTRFLDCCFRFVLLY
jgi:hypothetical protein